MRKTLNNQQIRKLLEDKKNWTQDYKLLAEELLQPQYIAPYDFIKVLREVYEDNKEKSSFTSLAVAALSLLHDIHLDTLYDELPVGSTVFVNDVAGVYKKNLYYYQLFSIKLNRNRPGEELHYKLTEHVARLLDLEQEELHGVGKFHSQLVLSYKGYATELVKALSDRLYDDPDALRCEVF